MAARKIIIAVLFFLAGFFFVPSARALTVSGTISDTRGQGVPFIKVCLVDYHYLSPDRIIHCVETDKSGRYSGTVAKGNSVYLRVYYESPVDPGTPSLAPGQKVRVVYNDGSEAITFSTAWGGGYLPSMAADGVINIPTGPGRPPLGNEIIGLTAVHDVFEFIRAQGVSNFKCNYDIKVDISTSDHELWPNATEDKTLHLGIDRLNGNNPEWYGVYHEIGHIIQYEAYSPPRWPKSKYPGGKHTRDSHSDEGFALSEGWAEGFGDLVCRANGHKPGDTSRTAWRGAGKLGAAGGNLGSPSGSDNSGEVVEGSICEIIKGSQFRYMLEGMILMSPDNYKTLMTGFYLRRGDGQAMLDLFALQRRWGIVYSRAKMAGFKEGETAGGGEEDPGNSAKVNGLVFVRGVIHPDYDENSKEELNLASSTTDISKIQMGYKKAVDGLAENDVKGFLKWTKLVGFRNLIEFKTTEAVEYDQDLDLILKVKDTVGSLDDFNPDFDKDPVVGGADYSTNERWLKHLGAWFNQDDYADNDDEGKVVLDNNRPLIAEKKFRPRAPERSGYLTGGDGTYVRISPPAPKN